MIDEHRHAITDFPQDGTRVLVGTEHTVFIGYWRPHGGPIIIESDSVPSDPLTWWEPLPIPGAPSQRVLDKRRSTL
jgi:hypothetical protein